LGLLLAVFVHSASWQDRTAARQFVRRTGPVSERLRIVFADLAYESGLLNKDVQTTWGARVELKKHPWQGSRWVWCAPGQKPPRLPPKPKGFVVLPKRWIVERTFAWISRFRRHSKDFEALPESSEAHIRISMIQIMLKRLSKAWD
jgi:transposase